METLRLTSADLLEYQKCRDPYLLIDEGTEVIPGISSKGFKQLTDKDWFFPCHFPGEPLMPGMLQIEALMQMTSLAIVTLPGNKGRIVYITSADKLKFRRKIVAGDRLDIDTKILSFKRGIGKAYGVGTVNGEFACEAELYFVVAEIMEEYNVIKMNRA